MTETIKAGDTITVDYTGKKTDGTVFDTSEGKEPLKFTVGAGMLILSPKPLRSPRKRDTAPAMKMPLWTFPRNIFLKKFP